MLAPSENKYIFGICESVIQWMTENFPNAEFSRMTIDNYPKECSIHITNNITVCFSEAWLDLIQIRWFVPTFVIGERPSQMDLVVWRVYSFEELKLMLDELCSMEKRFQALKNKVDIMRETNRKINN